MRIGIFGGSFNPVHIEHIRVAEAAIASLRLDTLFVMPAYAPPHKQGKEIADDSVRLEACRIAFQEVEKAVVCDYEIRKKGTSYTYLTCRHFRALYPQAEIFWLLGTDMLRDFPTWKETQSILNDVTLAVCARNEKEGWARTEFCTFREKFGREFEIVGYNGGDISSTKIRVLAGADEDIAPFVGEKVAAYIREKALYRIPAAKEALALQKPARAAHSIRVAVAAATRAADLGVPESKAVCAALLHDCGKNVDTDSPLLKGFSLLPEWGDVPPQVLHQFTGAYIAERALGVRDSEILDAIRFHTSGKEDMTALGKLIFLADLVEEGRSYEGVETLRGLFYEKKKGADGLDTCLLRALKETLEYLKKQGGEIYPLTVKAYQYMEVTINGGNNE